MTAENREPARYSEQELQRMFAEYISSQGLRDTLESSFELTPEQRALAEQLVEMTNSLEGKTEGEKAEIIERMKALTQNITTDTVLTTLSPCKRA